VSTAGDVVSNGDFPGLYILFTVVFARATREFQEVVALRPRCRFLHATHDFVDQFGNLGLGLLIHPTPSPHVAASLDELYYAIPGKSTILSQ
jgi:hypothetical protein